MLLNVLVLGVAILVGRKGLELTGNKNRSRLWALAAVAAVLAAAVIFATAGRAAGLTGPLAGLPALGAAAAAGLLAIRQLRGLGRHRSRWDIAADGAEDGPSPLAASDDVP